LDAEKELRKRGWYGDFPGTAEDGV
jgi:hypothetical protein